MKNRKPIHAVVLAGLLPITIPIVAADEALLPALPEGWSIRRAEVPAASREAVARKPGIPLRRLENCQVNAGAATLRLNPGTANDEAGARKPEKSFLAIHGNVDSFVARKGSVVAEISNAAPELAARVKHLLACNVPLWISEDGLKRLELWGLPEIERVE
jgi:hypothetical protein